MCLAFALGTRKARTAQSKPRSLIFPLLIIREKVCEHVCRADRRSIRAILFARAQNLEQSQRGSLPYLIIKHAAPCYQLLLCTRRVRFGIYMKSSSASSNDAYFFAMSLLLTMLSSFMMWS